MGKGESKPTVIGDEAKVHCDSDKGFKLIQINLDWNNNGDGITAASIFFIMVATVLLMLRCYLLWERRQLRGGRPRGGQGSALARLLLPCRLLLLYLSFLNAFYSVCFV